MKQLRVLVGCEFSGIVRDAFAALGHDAWSCDILPSEKPGNHIIGDIRGQLRDEWDLAIFHPPCPKLCNSGVRWLFGGAGAVRDMKRWQEMEDAADFFNELKNAPIERIALENPIPHRYAAEIIGSYTQIIQPWQFGHGETKATCLWLKNLTPLQPTNIVDGRTPRVHHASPGPDRWKERSRTMPGIAKAMAEQWSLLANPKPETKNEQ